MLKIYDNIGLLFAYTVIKRVSVVLKVYRYRKCEITFKLYQGNPMDDHLKELDRVKESQLQLMHFCASWSSPCIKQSAILDELSGLLPESIDIIKITIENPFADYKKFNIQALPTLCLISNGKEVKRFIGVQKLDTLVNIINFYIKKGER